jgi:hypothetical protein
MLDEKDNIKGTRSVKHSSAVKGNEAEEFITKIVLNGLFTGVVILVGVGIAFYCISGTF